MKNSGNTKEARRAYHEYLQNTKMKSGDDPDGFLYTMDGYRERLEDMGSQYPMSGTETSFFRPFLPSTRGSVLSAMKGGISTSQAFKA